MFSSPVKSLASGLRIIVHEFTMAISNFAIANSIAVVSRAQAWLMLLHIVSRFHRVFPAFRTISNDISPSIDSPQRSDLTVALATLLLLGATVWSIA